MENSKRKLLISILVLSVICALLIGFITGYFTSNFIMYRNIISAYTPHNVSNYDYEKREKPKVDIVYYNPGNDELWSNSYKEITEGNGLVKGQVFIDDKPAAGLEISLLLATGQKTHKAIIDNQGFYKIRLPRGKYYFNGLLVFNKGDLLHDKLLVNQVAREEGMSMILRDADKTNIQRQYGELEKKHGAKEAANILLKGLITSSGFRDRFPFEVGDKPLDFLVFHYRYPIRILSPVENSISTLADLQFIWSPVEKAAYYNLHITRIEQTGTGTSYRSVLTHNNIDKNQISYGDLLKSLSASKSRDECGKEDGLEPKKIYGLRIVAFDQHNRILTASSPSTTTLTSFSIKR